MSYGSVAEIFQGSVQGAIFVANRDGDSVSEVSLIGTTTATNIGLSPGSRPVALAATASTVVYVANSGTNFFCPSTGSVSVISTASLVATNTVCVGVSPVAIVQQPSGGYVYIANSGDNTISVFNPTSVSVSATLTQAGGLHQNPVAMVASPDGAYIYVVAQGNGTTAGWLDIITTSNNIVAASIPLGISPTSAYYDTFLNRLYVTNTGDNTVTVFDASNVSIGVNPAIPTLATVSVGSAPVSVAALPNRKAFYVANRASNTVSVVSSTSFAVVGTVGVGQKPAFVATEPSSTKVYIANSAGGNISIIHRGAEYAGAPAGPELRSQGSILRAATAGDDHHEVAASCDHKLLAAELLHAVTQLRGLLKLESLGGFAHFVFQLQNVGIELGLRLELRDAV